jgi:tetratricopeptide (TPR) repeat protein
MGLNGRFWAGVALQAACLGAAATAHAACTAPANLKAQYLAHPSSENAIQLGGWYATNKQFECAVQVFREAVKAHPDSAQLHYLEGLSLVDSGHPDEAIPTLQSSARLQPGLIKPHLLLADVYERTRQPAQADEQWRQAQAIDPHSPLLLEEWSGAMLARGDYGAVIDLLKPAPRTETLSIRLAKAYGLLNHLDAAKQVLVEAMNLSPKSLPLADAESVVLIKQLHYDEAVKLLSNMVQLHPGDLDAEVSLFRVLVLTQHLDRARPMAPKLLALRPHDPDILYLNGIVERTFGDYSQAKAHLEEAISIDPNFFYSRFNLGKVLVILHEWAPAKEQLEKAIELGDIEPQVHYELAMALRGLGDSEHAAAEIKKYEELRKAEESSLEASMNAAQGDIELAANDIPEAIRQYGLACAALPDNARYKFQLSVALDKAGKLDDERTQLEEATKLDPQLSAAQEQLGYLLSRSGDAAGAIEHFKTAVQFAPNWVEGWINLAAELAVEARFPEARQAVANALRLDRTNEQAHELSDQLARDPSAQQAHP